MKDLGVEKVKGGDGRSARTPAWALLAVLITGTACPSAAIQRGAPADESAVSKPAPTPDAAGLPFVAEVAPVRALAGSGSSVWAASARGLRRWDLARSQVRSWTAEDGLPGTAVSSLALEGDEAVWVATDAGVARGRPATDDARFEKVSDDRTITHVFMGAETVFFGGSGGLSRFDPKTRRSEPLGLAGPITVLGRGSAGGLCAASATAGVACFDEAGGRIDAASPEPSSVAGLSFVGLAHEAGGTAVMGGAAPDGSARLLFLSARGPALYEGEGMPPIVALAEGNDGPVLLLAHGEGSRAYRLRRAERGQVALAGTYRLAPTSRRLDAPRYVAEPTGPLLAFSTTSALATGGDLFLGTAHEGVVRASSLASLPGGELAEEERGLTAICENPGRCVLATGAPSAWWWNGRGLEPLAIGPPEDHILRVEGVWRGAEGASWALTAEKGFHGFSIWRAAGDLTRWEKVTRVPVSLPEEEAVARFVFAAPSRNVWIGLWGREARGGEDRDKARGVLELEPGSWKTWLHPGLRGTASTTPVKPAPKKKGHDLPATPAAVAEGGLPLPDDVTGVWVSEVDGQPATWFCTSSGVFRFLQGALRVWGENEGFQDESCLGIAEGPDHAIWAATRAGVMRFAGNRWSTLETSAWPRERDGDRAAALSVLAGRAGMRGTPLPGSWIGTGNGFLAVPTAEAGAARVLDASRGLRDRELRALADDGEGRLWALGSAGITLVDPASFFGTSRSVP